jgi:hypothetical protein
MACTELRFRGAIDREHETRIVTNEKLKSIQKFAFVIITRFSIASQRPPFDATIPQRVLAEVGSK